MALGPGKYDELTTEVRRATHADGVILLVVNGTRGHGLSFQLTPALTMKLPLMLRELADAIETKGVAAV